MPLAPQTTATMPLAPPTTATMTWTTAATPLAPQTIATMPLTKRILKNMLKKHWVKYMIVLIKLKKKFTTVTGHHIPEHCSKRRLMVFQENATEPVEAQYLIGCMTENAKTYTNLILSQTQTFSIAWYLWVRPKGKSSLQVGTNLCDYIGTKTLILSAMLLNALRMGGDGCFKLEVKGGRVNFRKFRMLKKCSSII